MFRVLTRRLGWTFGDAKEAVAALLADIPHVATTRESKLAAFGLCADHGVAFRAANFLSAASWGGLRPDVTEGFQDRRRFDPPHVARAVWILNPFLEANRAALEALGVLPS